MTPCVADARRPPAHLRRDRGLCAAGRLRFIWTSELRILGSNGWEPDDIRELFALVGDGKLKVLIDHADPLEDGALAVKAVEDRAVFGKVAVTP